jgi:uncharacterized protein YodC (DUF2158 family)
MADNAIKAGDVVQLKSGGPAMSVAWLGKSTVGVDVASCVWFSIGGELVERPIAIAALGPKTNT